MTQPDQTPNLFKAPLPEAMKVWLRHLAVQKVSERRGRVLWSCGFPLPGLSKDVSLEVLPTLALRVRNRMTGEVYVQTEPVQFGPPLASDDKALAEQFEQWSEERRAAWDAVSRGRATDAVADQFRPPCQRKKRVTASELLSPAAATAESDAAEGEPS